MLLYNILMRLSCEMLKTSNKMVKNNIAITGEIDLAGNVLPIGGLETKLYGAKRAGVKLVLYPYSNESLMLLKKKIQH